MIYSYSPTVGRTWSLALAGRGFCWGAPRKHLVVLVVCVSDLLHRSSTAHFTCHGEVCAGQNGGRSEPGDRESRREARGARPGEPLVESGVLTELLRFAGEGH